MLLTYFTDWISIRCEQSNYCIFYQSSLMVFTNYIHVCIMLKYSNLLIHVIRSIHTPDWLLFKLYGQIDDKNSIKLNFTIFLNIKILYIFFPQFVLYFHVNTHFSRLYFCKLFFTYSLVTRNCKGSPTITLIITHHAESAFT